MWDDMRGHGATWNDKYDMGWFWQGGTWDNMKGHWMAWGGIRDHKGSHETLTSISEQGRAWRYMTGPGMPWERSLLNVCPQSFSPRRKFWPFVGFYGYCGCNTSDIAQNRSDLSDNFWVLGFHSVHSTFNSWGSQLSFDVLSFKIGHIVNESYQILKKWEWFLLAWYSGWRRDHEA